MLLIDDDDELPEVPSPEEEEVELAEQLGVDGLNAIDAALLAWTERTQHKVARIVARALDAGGFLPSDDYIELHVRRFINLARAGKVEVFGDPRKPRFSEARLPRKP